MTKPLTIAIAGAGIGGLAAAVLLARRDHRVTVFDRFAAPAPVGSGLVIQPIGQAVLARLGVLEQALALGCRLDRLSGIEDGQSRPVLDVTYGGRFGLALHRAALFEVLYRAALAAGVSLRSNATVASSRLVDNGRSVGFANGTSEGPFDLVVDATGAASPLSRIKNRPLPFGALWATVNWPSDTDLPPDRLSQKYRKAAIMAGVLPIGRLPGEALQKAAIFWSMRHRDYPDWRASDFGGWQAQVCDFWPGFAPFLSQIEGPDGFTLARYSHGTLRRPYEARLVQIGDAAHTASPQLGQGANMALLDAWALATCLAALPPDQALPAYAKSRRLHLLTYQGFSRFLTPLYQSGHWLPPIIRNHVLAPVSRIPPMPAVLSRIVSGDLIAPMRGFMKGQS